MAPNRIGLSLSLRRAAKVSHGCWQSASDGRNQKMRRTNAPPRGGLADAGRAHEEEDSSRSLLTEMHAPGWPAGASGADLTGRQRPKIHMHPAKRRLLLVLALGSVLGGVLVLATLQLVVTPLRRWGDSHVDAHMQLSRLDGDALRMREVAFASTRRMKEFLSQLQRLHASSTMRTALVEKAAGQSYREHARDRLHEHFMAIKEGILLQASQRRRIDDARQELVQMNLTADALVQQLTAEDSVPESNHVEIEFASASSMLAKSIRDIRVAMIEHAKNESSDRLASVAPAVQEASRAREPREQQASRKDHHQHDITVYLTVFGVLGVWMWSVVTDEATREKSFVFRTHKAIWHLLSSIVVVEKIEDAGEGNILGSAR